MKSSSIDAHNDEGVGEQVIRLLEGFDVLVSFIMLVSVYSIRAEAYFELAILSEVNGQ